MARCGWRVQGGVRFHLPQCYAGAMTEGQQCHCGPSKTDAITTLEERVSHLEDRLALLSAPSPAPINQQPEDV